MSASLKLARQRYPGSMPGQMMQAGGLLGSIWGGIKTVAKGAAGFAVGGPVGAAAAVLPSLVGGGGNGRAQIPQLPPELQMKRPGPIGAAQRFLPGGSSGMIEASVAQPKGYHANKTGYWLKDGTYVAPKSKWVKNRRRNPLNPTALRHAVGRIDAGKIWQGKLHEIETGKYTKAGNRKSCA